MAKAIIYNSSAVSHASSANNGLGNIAGTAGTLNISSQAFGGLVDMNQKGGLVDMNHYNGLRSVKATCSADSPTLIVAAGAALSLDCVQGVTTDAANPGHVILGRVCNMVMGGISYHTAGGAVVYKGQTYSNETTDDQSFMILEDGLQLEVTGQVAEAE